MRDIRYKWNEGLSSVGVSNDVSLPQFKVLGHRQRAHEISLTTGNVSTQPQSLTPPSIPPSQPLAHGTLMLFFQTYSTFFYIFDLTSNSSASLLTRGSCSYDL